MVTARVAARLGLTPKLRCVCRQLPADIAAAALPCRTAAKGNFPMWKLVPSKLERMLYRTLSQQITRIYLGAKN